MNYKLKVFFGSLTCVLFIYVLLFLSIQTTAFSKSFYTHQNKSLQISEDMRISAKDYTQSISTLLDYLDDTRDDIKVKIEYHGMEREAFNQKEITHMVDVRNLYLNARLLCFFAIGIVLFLTLILYFDQKKEFLEIISIAYVRVGILFLFILCGLILYACIDFNTFWTKFHHIFFSNNLWLLDYRTDLMIQMLPEDLFFAMVIRIIGMFAALFLVFFIGSTWYLKRHKKLYLVLFS